MLGHDCHSIVAGEGHANVIIAQYPEYSGLNYLDMTSGMFFSQN